MTTSAEDVRAYVREQMATGRKVTGAELHERFGISDSLGRRRIREVAAEITPVPERSLVTIPGDRVPRRTDVPLVPSRNGHRETPEELAELLGGTLDPEPGPETPLPETPEPPKTPMSVPSGDVKPHSGRNLKAWTFAAVLLVALVAAVVSYAHQQALAFGVGESWRSWLIPLSVDGLIAAASWTLVARRRAGKPAKLATGGLLLGILASVAANVASAWSHGPVAWLVALWAPVALIVSIELLAQHVRKDD